MIALSNTSVKTVSLGNKSSSKVLNYINSLPILDSFINISNSEPN